MSYENGEHEGGLEDYQPGGWPKAREWLHQALGDAQFIYDNGDYGHVLNRSLLKNLPKVIAAALWEMGEGDAEEVRRIIDEAKAKHSEDRRGLKALERRQSQHPRG